MREIEIHLPHQRNVESRIDAAIHRAGLAVTMKGTLAKHTGCIHWHVKRGREKGTLEITWWPAEGRAWFKIATTRAATWIDDVLPSLKRQIESINNSNA